MIAEGTLGPEGLRFKVECSRELRYLAITKYHHFVG